MVAAVRSVSTEDRELERSAERGAGPRVEWRVDGEVEAFGAEP